MKRFSACLFAALISILLVVPCFAAPQDESDFEWKPLVSLTSWDSSAATFVWSLPGLATYRAAGNNCVLYPYIVMTGGTLTHIGYIDPSGLGTNHVWENGTSFAIASDPSRLDASLPSSISYGVGRKNTSSGAFRFNEDIPRFSSDIEALHYFVDNDPSTVYYNSNFNVPAGYVAVFKASSGTALSGSAVFGFKSYPINLSVSAFGNTGQGYGYLDGAPSGSLTFPTSTFTYFPWQKGNPRDAFGQTYNGTFSLNLNPSSGQFCYIYNPLYNPNAKDGPLNPTISVNVNGITDLRLYPLHNGVVDAGDGWGSSSDDGYANPYIGNIDPDTGSVSYEDSSGNPVIPEYGGSNIVPDVDASQSLGEAVKSILKEIVSAITGIFSLAYQAIISLVGLAGPFFGKLAALYSWLPAPVLTALTSAMTLAVTIGVIRAFL